MRDAIKKRLSEQVPELKGQVYDLRRTEDLATNLPAVSVVLGESGPSPMVGTRWRHNFYLRLFASGTDFTMLDQIASHLVSALDEHILSDLAVGSFYCQYLGAKGAESLVSSSSDSAANILMRELYFAADMLWSHPAGSNESMDEPQIALLQFTKEQLSPEWSVHAGSWPQDCTWPAILWRSDGCELKLSGASGYEMHRSFTAHVMGKDPSEEVTAILKLISSFGQQVKVPVSAENRTYMSPAEVHANLLADPRTSGQLKVTMVSRLHRSFEEAALMRQVHYSSEP